MVGYVCVPGANIAQRCVFSGPEVNNSLQMFLPSAANQKSRSTADGGFKLGEQKTPSENNRMLTRIRFLASQHLNNEPEVFIYRQDSPPERLQHIYQHIPRDVVQAPCKVWRFAHILGQRR